MREVKPPPLIAARQAENKESLQRVFLLQIPSQSQAPEVVEPLPILASATVSSQSNILRREARILLH